MFGRQKRWRDFSKQPQRIYLTEGERREKGKVKRRSGREDKYVCTEPHYTHVTSHYLQISSSTPQLAAVSQ